MNETSEQERQWLERRLRTANVHTEDAFLKLQAAMAELDIMRKKLQRAVHHQEIDQETIDKLRIRLDRAQGERDEAQFWAKKLMREHS